MWPLTLMRSAPSVFAEKGSFIKACTASVCSSAREPFSRSIRATPAISVTPPVSLLTIISETSAVSSRSAAFTSPTRTAPSGPGFRRVTSQPCASSSSRLFRTASCSTSEETICLPVRFAASAPPSRAQLSLSEPQDVKTSSSAAQPSASATAAREEQSSFAASRPLAWVELGLP